MRTPLCSKNHPMNFMSLQQLIPISPEYSSGCSCDWCHNAPTGKFYHCNICNYDVCEQCVLHGPQHTETHCYSMYNTSCPTSGNQQYFNSFNKECTR